MGRFAPSAICTTFRLTGKCEIMRDKD